MITLMVMSCMWVNNMLFCAEGTKNLREVAVRKQDITVLDTQRYRFVPNLTSETLAHAVTDKFVHETMNGCKIITAHTDSMYYEFPCSHLLKVIKSQKCD